MSILKDVLLEEYNRLKKIEILYQKRVESLPTGYLSRKIINGKEYVYLQHRSGNKVVSRYIPKNEVNNYIKLIDEKKEYKKRLKEVRVDMADLCKVLKDNNYIDCDLVKN